MSHIFISYNQSDADFAAVLSIHIEKAGVDTWMDKSRLRPGQDWSVEIDEAIINSHALVVIMSPEAKASEYVTYEWSFALGAGVQVIPVMYKETVLHPRLARLQYLKFTDTTVRPWDVLIDTVNEAVSDSSLHVVRIPRNAPSHVKRAILALDSANDADREGAIRVLAQTDHAAAREALLSALQHPLPSVRWYAALHVFEDSRAIPVLIDAFQSDHEPGKRQEAHRIKCKYANHMADFGSAGMNALLNLLILPDVDVVAVTEGLSRFVGGETVPSLIQLLHDPDSRLRYRAAKALGNAPPHLVEAELIHALQDSDEEVRLAAVQSLSCWTRDGRHVVSWEGLIAGLRNTSKKIRDAAVEEFHWGPPVSTQQKLFELARSGSVINALAAFKALLQSGISENVMIGQGLLVHLNEGIEVPLGTVLLGRKIPRKGGGFLETSFYVLSSKDEEIVQTYKVEDDDDELLINRERSIPGFISNFLATNLFLKMDSAQE